MPELRVKVESVAIDDGCARVITTVYVLIVVPFCAVEVKLNVLAPTAKARFADEWPAVTNAPFTVTVAVASVSVGVRVRLVVV